MNDTLTLTDCLTDWLSLELTCLTDYVRTSWECKSVMKRRLAAVSFQFHFKDSERLSIFCLSQHFVPSYFDLWNWVPSFMFLYCSFCLIFFVSIDFLLLYYFYYYYLYLSIFFFTIYDQVLSLRRKIPIFNHVYK